MRIQFSSSISCHQAQEAEQKSGGWEPATEAPKQGRTGMNFPYLFPYIFHSFGIFPNIHVAKTHHFHYILHHSPSILTTVKGAGWGNKQKEGKGGTKYFTCGYYFIALHLPSFSPCHPHTHTHTHTHTKRERERQRERERENRQSRIK
jgi:hypothetical protein